MRITFILLCILSAPASILAQEPRPAVIAGTVTDQSGGALAGVDVTLQENGRAMGTTTTDKTGLYRLEEVSPGTYLLRFELAGFHPVQRSIAVEAGAEVRLPIVMLVSTYSEQVTVTATREERLLALVPASIGVVSTAQIESARTINLVDALREIPGVYAGNVSGVDDLRIAIRGAGVRATFGSRGVLLLTDGVPVTEPDGQTPHIDGQVDLASAARVEVVKGPASAVYGGAALGGVVNVITRPPSREPHAELRAEGGSYDFGKGHARGSGGLGPWLMAGSLGYTTLDGFREHNSLRNWMANARADWKPSGADLVSFRFLFTDAQLELPGALDREQFARDPSQVRSIFVTNNWGRDNRIYRFGGRYERQIGSRQTLELDSYGQFRDLFHPIFVVIDQDARRYLGHARYRYASSRHVLATGMDLDTQNVNDRWFVNVGGRPAFQIRDDDDLVTNLGIYVQDEVPLGRRWTLTAGVRYDRVTYDLEDRILRDGDASDRRVFERASPKIGVVGQVLHNVTVYGNVSTGFETPTVGEVRLPAGFNTQVKPPKAVSVEGGIRGGQGPVSYDVSLYRMQVTDEILPVTIDNVSLFRNVAETSHTGLELTGRYRASAGVQLDGSYAWSRFILEEFDAFSGNRLPGIPTHAGTVNLTLGPYRGWDGAVGLVWAGQTYVDDANTEAADGYGVLSAMAAYTIGRVRIFARGENLTDKTYTNRVQVNDNGGFFFFPAPGRQATIAVQVRW